MHSGSGAGLCASELVERLLDLARQAAMHARLQLPGQRMAQQFRRDARCHLAHLPLPLVAQVAGRQVLQRCQLRFEVHQAGFALSPARGAMR